MIAAVTLALVVSFTRRSSGPDLATAKTSADSALAIALLADARTDSPMLYIAGAVFDGASHLPSRWTEAVLASLSNRLPGQAIRKRVAVSDTVIAGVPVVWMNRDSRANGVIVYVHGGAYVVGPNPSDWDWIAELTRRTSMASVTILYGMPPDHPFPAALDDAVHAIGALLDAGLLARDRWILAGVSAGGGLALTTLRTLIDEGKGPPPAGLLLEAPWVDLRLAGPQVAAAEKADPVLHRTWLAWSARQYAHGVPLDDPRLSPVLAPVGGFPPARIDVGTRDLFLPDDRVLRHHLVAAGVPVDYHEQRGGMHCFALDVTQPDAQCAIAQQVQWIEARLANASVPNASVANASVANASVANAPVANASVARR